MKYVKLALGILAVILLVLMLAVGVRLARELMMGGVNWLTAMGDMPVEAAETPAPTPVPAETVYEEEGGLDGDLLPKESYGNVVYDTEGMDLFEVPVESLAEDLPLLEGTPEPKK